VERVAGGAGYRWSGLPVAWVAGGAGCRWSGLPVERVAGGAGCRWSGLSVERGCLRMPEASQPVAGVWSGSDTTGKIPPI
jgi:hypothetical protein